jgi:hypothetical protein
MLNYISNWNDSELDFNDERIPDQEDERERS